MATWLALQLLRGTRVRNSMSEVATHALLIQVVVGGRAGMRDALIAAGEPSDDATVDRGWVDFFKNPYRLEARANHHVQHLSPVLPRVTESLLDRFWLLSVYERKKLATSGHPVYVVPNREMTQKGMRTGIENATVIHAPSPADTRSRCTWHPQPRPNLPPSAATVSSQAWPQQPVQQLMHRQQRPPLPLPPSRGCAASSTSFREPRVSRPRRG